MQDVSLDHAKAHLEELIARASRGEPVRISDPALGSVRLIADEANPCPPAPARIPGRWKGKISISHEELFEPLSEAELAWLSGEESS